VDCFAQRLAPSRLLALVAIYYMHNQVQPKLRQNRKNSINRNAMSDPGDRAKVGQCQPVGWVERFAKPTNSAAAMGFVTSSDMRPTWSLHPSYE